MPLVTCPDCGKQVSDHAPSCPNCGCPISSLKDLNTVKIKYNLLCDREQAVVDCKEAKILATGSSKATFVFQIDSPTDIMIFPKKTAADPHKCREFISKCTQKASSDYPMVTIEPGKRYTYGKVATGFFENHFHCVLNEVDVVDSDR